MKAYLDLLRHVLENGESHDDRTGVGTLSVFGYQFRHNMRVGFPLLTTKKLPFRWIAEELFWFLRGSTNEHELEQVGVDIWKEWADEEHCAKFGRDPGDLGPVYGELWRSFPNGLRKCDTPLGGGHKYTDPNQVLFIDQIACLLSDIKNNPYSRRLLVSGWHPYYQHQVDLPPCHTIWQIKIHPNDEMSLHLYARSIDSFLGLPFNIASYALLLSMIAKVTEHEPRELIISFGDLHIYKNHIPQVKQQLTRLPKSLPLLGIDGMESQVGDTPLVSLLSIGFRNLKLWGYHPYPTIKAEVAI